MGVIAGVLTGGVALVGGLIAGSAAGAAVGAFMKESLHMTKEEIDGLAPELSAGKVALVVTCDDYEVGPTQAQLDTWGGMVRNYAVPSKALAAAVAAGVGADWPTEPFEPEPFDSEFFESEPFESEPTPVPERTSALPERTAVPEFTVAASENVAAPGPTTAFADASSGAEPNLHSELF